MQNKHLTINAANGDHRFLVDTRNILMSEKLRKMNLVLADLHKLKKNQQNWGISSHLIDL